MLVGMIVETGSIVPGADSYCSLAAADAYHAARGLQNAGWAALPDAEREAALIRATDYIEAVWGGDFGGYRTSESQDLSWPRIGAVNAITGIEYAQNSIPSLLVRACAELALRAIGTDLSPDAGAQVIKERVDVIEVTYDKGTPSTPRFTAVENIIAPLLARAQSSVTVRLRRV